MAGNGPAPKPAGQRRRRNPSPGFRQLPHEGRVGELPAWPIDKPRDAELEVWADLWKLPQAVEWERLEYTRVVARYVRTLVASEMHAADIKLLTEVRQLEDRLGLTPKAMQTLRWETDEPEVVKNGGAKKVAPIRAYVPKGRAS
jgi:hypothetical protein